MICNHELLSCPDPSTDGWLVYCEVCKLSAYGKTRMQAIEAWRSGRRRPLGTEPARLVGVTAVEE